MKSARLVASVVTISEGKGLDRGLGCYILF